MFSVSLWPEQRINLISHTTLIPPLPSAVSSLDARWPLGGNRYAHTGGWVSVGGCGCRLEKVLWERIYTRISHAWRDVSSKARYQIRWPLFTVRRNPARTIFPRHSLNLPHSGVRTCPIFTWFYTSFSPQIAQWNYLKVFITHTLRNKTTTSIFYSGKMTLTNTISVISTITHC